VGVGGVHPRGHVLGHVDGRARDAEGGVGLPRPRGDTLRGETMWVANNTRKVAATRQEAKYFALVKRAYHARMCAERLEQAQTRLAALQALKVSDGV